MPIDNLRKVFRATTFAKITCAISSWSGVANSEDFNRIKAFLKRSTRLGYCSPADQDILAHCTTSDSRLFKKIINNPEHILFNRLPLLNLFNTLFGRKLTNSP